MTEKENYLTENSHLESNIYGVSYSQKICRTWFSRFCQLQNFPVCVFQILREYQNVKIVKSKCKSEEGKKSK